MAWWFVFLFAVLAVSILVLPWKVEFSLSTTEGIHILIRFMNRFRVLTVSTGMGRSARVKIIGVSISRRGKKAGPAPGNQRPDRWTGLLKAVMRTVTMDTLIVLARYFRGMINSTESALEISGEIGLDDPAMTGMAYGLACGLHGARGIGKLDIRPNFERAVAAGEVRLAASIIPAAAFIRTARAAFHPAVRRVWFALLDRRETGYIKEVRNIGS